MGSGIFTYRIEDGNFAEPPFKGIGFIVTAPDGHDLPLPWPSCRGARAFCEQKNRKIAEGRWPNVN
jgi:hypothetical protein